MLKRCQVLLSDWLVDYIKDNAEKFDVSFSEVIRLSLCMQFGSWISQNYPNHKFAFDQKKLKKAMQAVYEENGSREDEHKLMSKIYFEARKAIEFALSKEKKSK